MTELTTLIRTRNYMTRRTPAMLSYRGMGLTPAQKHILESLHRGKSVIIVGKFCKRPRHFYPGSKLHINGVTASRSSLLPVVNLLKLHLITLGDRDDQGIIQVTLKSDWD